MNNLEQIMTILEESRHPLSQMIDLIEASEHNVGDVWQSDKNENYYYRREKNRTVRIPNPTPEEKKQAERQKVKDEASATKGGSEPAKTLPPKPTKENPDPLTALLTKTLPPVRREAEKSDKDLDMERMIRRTNRRDLIGKG